MAVTLKAKWSNDMFGITYMHEMSSAICANTTTPNKTANATTNISTNDKTKIPETTLIDYRDGKSYLIRKYANGECWMVQNLEFDFKTTSNGYASNSTTVTATTLNTTYTDIEDATSFNSSTNAFRRGKFYATQSVPTKGSTTTYVWGNSGEDGAHSYSVSASGHENYVIRDSGTGGNGYYLFKVSTTGQPYQRRGNLYNWTAATAGDMQMTEGKRNNSICPKNWQLPNNSNSSSKSYDALIKYYRNDYNPDASGGNTLIYNYINSFPLDLGRGGIYDNGNIQRPTEYANWWTNYGQPSGNPTRANSPDTYINSVGGYAVVNTNYNGYRGYGDMIRCVAR